MKMKGNRPTLLVEGIHDHRVIKRLLTLHGFNTEHPKFPEIVHDGDVEDRGGGVSKVLSRIAVSARNESTLGIVIDADATPVARWTEVWGAVAQAIRTSDVPLAPSDGGFIMSRPNLPGHKLGVWLMPDNASPGMLENFIASLIPASDRCWPHARESTRRARVDHGAGLREIHESKGAINAWLAWQDPSGKPITTVLGKQALDHDAPPALAFVTWFQRLFDLSPVQRGT